MKVSRWFQTHIKTVPSEYVPKLWALGNLQPKSKVQSDYVVNPTKFFFKIIVNYSTISMITYM